MAKHKPAALFPKSIGRSVACGVIALAIVAAGLIIWRGPAIMLDIAAVAAWCF